MKLDDLSSHELLDLSTMTLATANSSGEPHAAAVYFAADGELRLYFFSEPDSRHSRDAAENPVVAAAIYPECRGWREIRGLQMRGEVRPVARGPEWDRAWALYAAKFPFVSALKVVVARNQLYAFTPHWIRLVDNRRGFGFKEEWSNQ